MKWARTGRAGFTIVELLIVVVVIAILAAITIVAYNGVTRRAVASSLQTEITSAIKAAEQKKIQSGLDTYPASKTDLGMADSSNLSYFSTAISYCVEATKDGQTFSASSANTAIINKPCAENGLIGWWPLNGNATDSSSSGYNGTVSNTTLATGQNGQANQALAFSSASTSNVTIPHTAALNTKPESFSLWVYPTSWASADASVMINKRSNVGNGYFIAYITVSAQLAFDCGGSGTRWVTGFVPPLNTWSHVVLTCSTAGGLALYVNGAPYGTRSYANRTTMATSTADLKFGQDTNAGGQLYNGRMDDIRIYDRVLSADEANALYTAGAR